MCGPKWCLRGRGAGCWFSRSGRWIWVGRNRLKFGLDSLRTAQHVGPSYLWAISKRNVV